MDIENIKKAVKESIVQNFMESTKTVRMTDGPGKNSQRPKSWSKGIKSGSHKRKMREQGKRDASEMHEQYTEPGYQYNPQPDDPEPGQPGGPRDIEAERREMGKSISGAVRDWVQETGLHKYHGHSTDEMLNALKAGIEKSYNTNNGNIKHDIADAASDLISIYPAPKGVDPKQYKMHMEQGIHGYATATSRKHRHEMLTGNPYYDAINESYDVSSYYYNRLKEETNDIPRHARETPEETPDYYGQLKREREQGLSNEEPPNKISSIHHAAHKLNQAHEIALGQALDAFGKGGKHEGQDPFYMVKHYLENIEGHHTRIMGDLS